MNWEAIGAIAEVGAAIGVILTLFYLSYQIRHNSQVVRSSTRQSISAMQTEIGLQIASDPILRRAAQRWLRDTAVSEDPEDLLVDELFIRSNLRMYENQFLAHEEGTFTDEVWAGYHESIRRTLDSRIFRNWWKDNRELYGSSFASFVDTVLENSGDAR